MNKILLVLSAVLLLSACTDPKGATKALLDQGYEPIEVGGWRAMSCSKGDVFTTKFRAKNPDGREVKGVVCSGLLKGATIRTL